MSKTLPPLPRRFTWDLVDRNEVDLFTAEQMKAYAIAAIDAQGVPAEKLTPVIQWLESGCEPKHAATELRLLAAATQQEQRPTGFVVPTHFDPITGAGIPDPTTFGAAPQAKHNPLFGEMIAKLEWLAEELKAIDAA